VWFTGAYPDSTVYLPLRRPPCFSFARVHVHLPERGGPPRDISRGGEDASSQWGYGVWTAEEPWFTKRTRQNISRIVHVGAINQAGGSSRTDWRAPGPCFCNKVRVVSDLCAISLRHLPRMARDDLLSDPGAFCVAPFSECKLEINAK